MKKNMSIIFLVVFIIVTLILFMIHVNKNNNKISEDEKYTKLFNDALVADGAYAEGFYSELSNLFLREPDYFIEQLSLLNKDERETISFNVAFIMCINEPELNKKFESTLSGIEHKDNNLEFNTTLDNLIKNYESIKNDND
ncbi:hypothetical protein [Tissierella sp.]|uniref:hypothetical protein n=1 Tax=Tissierella sp. TaxID=41274 RepID=UPI0028AF1B4E|nr:hypothetical protein [Tissierella sp.]